MRLKLIAAVAVVTVLSMTAAFAGFTAYNDGLWANDAYFGTLQPNVNNVQTAGVTAAASAWLVNTSGVLKDYSTGNSTGVTVNLISKSSGTNQGVLYEPGNFGSMAVNSGTDAYTAFNGIVDLNGFIRYGDVAGWWTEIEFTGLNPNAKYEFVGTANRNGSSYTDRLAKFTLMGADSFLNSSSIGATIGTTSAANDTTTFCTGYNTVNGYVAKWTEIVAGADGTFKIREEAAGAQSKTYVFQAWMLKEVDPVPEPGSMLALGSGLIGFAGFAVRRRIRK